MPYANPLVQKAWGRKYYRDHREEILRKAKEGYDPQIKKMSNKDYKCRNLEALRERARQYRVLHLEECRTRYRDYYHVHRLRLIKTAIEVQRIKYKTVPIFRAITDLRKRLQKALKVKRYKKGASFWKLLGCDPVTLRLHIEAQFKPGMTWRNRGEWHIDHIRPCASFNLRDVEQQHLCFHYTNLQPLWASENLRKGAKIPDLKGEYHAETNSSSAS